MLSTKPRLRIGGHGAHLRVRQSGNWAIAPFASLTESCRASIAIEKTLVEAIGRARADGMSWDEIGRVLGATEHAENKHHVVDGLVAQRRVVLDRLLSETN